MIATFTASWIMLLLGLGVMEQYLMVRDEVKDVPRSHAD